MGYPWVWPTCETLHFIGMALLMGVVGVIDLRMLGVMKSLSFAPLHRLLPWGIAGFVINLTTGLMFLPEIPISTKTTSLSGSRCCSSFWPESTFSFST